MGKTYTQMTALIASWMGRDDLTTKIPDFLNMAIHNLERKYNWRFMRVRNTVAVASGDYLVANPVARYKAIFSSSCIDSNGNRFPFTKLAEEMTQGVFDDFTNSTGRPEVYSEHVIADTTALSRGTTSDVKVLFAAASFIGTDGAIYSYAAQEVALDSGTVTADKWGIWRFYINNAGTIVSDAPTSNVFDTEALALAGLPAVPAGYIDIGYITVKTKSGTTFVPTTDGLTGGTSGNVASITNYYVSDMQAITKLLIRPTADDSYTLDFFGYQYSPDLDGVVYTSNWWLANAWEVLLYASLLEAEPYMINDARMMTWRAKLIGDGNETVPKGVLGDLLKSERDEEFGDGFLTIGMGGQQAQLIQSRAYVYSFGGRG